MSGLPYRARFRRVLDAGIACGHLTYAEAMDLLLKVDDWGRRERLEGAAEAALGGEDQQDRKPRWVDLFGAAPDYCGGMDVDEWLDKNRGEA